MLDIRIHSGLMWYWCETVYHSETDSTVKMITVAFQEASSFDEMLQCHVDKVNIAYIGLLSVNLTTVDLKSSLYESSPPLNMILLRVQDLVYTYLLSIPAFS